MCLGFLIAQVHAQFDYFCVFLAHRYVQVFDVFAHRCYLVRQYECRVAYFIQLKLLLLYVMAYLSVLDICVQWSCLMTLMQVLLSMITLDSLTIVVLS